MISFQLNQSLASRYGGSISETLVKRAFEFNQIDEALATSVERSINTDCAVVFSDISRFSSTMAEMSAEEIKNFLDLYYTEIIPIIYKHGGLIDQMFGDGIISVFCDDLSPNVTGSVFDAGLNAARQIIKTFAGHSDCSTKCALHKDKAVICEVGDDNYRQATIVGNVMTAVHRVESVAVDEAVNMLLSIPEAAALHQRFRLSSIVRRLQGISLDTEWRFSVISSDLKGLPNNPQKILVQRYVK